MMTPDDLEKLDRLEGNQIANTLLISAAIKLALMGRSESERAERCRTLEDLVTAIPDLPPRAREMALQRVRTAFEPWPPKVRQPGA